MSKWHKPRMMFKVVGEHIRDTWTVEFDAHPEMAMTTEFHFDTMNDAEEFYKLNSEEAFNVPGTDDSDT